MRGTSRGSTFTSISPRIPDRPGGGNLALGGASRDTLRYVGAAYAADDPAAAIAATGFRSIRCDGWLEEDNSASTVCRAVSIFGYRISR